MRIALESADQPDVMELIDELDAYQKPLYPAESHHGIDLAALLEPGVLFAVARDDGGQTIGCGRVVLETGYLQSEAITLYERSGYRRRGPFGAYVEDPNSVFVQKVVSGVADDRD